MSNEKTTFEIWALVELFGHQRLAGKVSEQVIAGAGFVRIDIPETARRSAHSRFYNPSAIYGMTPLSEEDATRLAQAIYMPDIIPLTAPIRQLEDGE